MTVKMYKTCCFVRLRPREDDEDMEPAELAEQIECQMQKKLWPSNSDSFKDEFKAYMDQVTLDFTSLQNKLFFW